MLTQPAADPQQNPLVFLRALYDAAVAAAKPSEVLADFMPTPPSFGKGRTLVIGAGKGAAAMAMAFEALWPADLPLEGVLVTRYGHIPAEFDPNHSRLRVLEASHPVPDAASEDAARQIMAAVQGLSSHDLVVCLMSGGASALLSLPAEGITLDQKRAINKALLESGASIDEINCVRKHLSAIKGGRLAARCAPARVVTLLISDVPGDDPAVVGSGPSMADPSTCAQALAICQRYQIALPEGILAAWQDGSLETPKPGSDVFAHHEVHVIATPQKSLEAAARLAEQSGMPAHILSDAIEGESRDIGQMHGALARAVAQKNAPFSRPCVILSGGETTVTIRPETPPGGRGGRAGEFLLGCAHALQGQAGVYVLAADTDGIDGIEDNAGAFLTPDTLLRAQGLQLKLKDAMARHDAYGYFQSLGDLLITGPTHTNVNDFRALLIL